MTVEPMKSIEPSLKEALYRVLEEVQATKAALFLMHGERYVLATQYGFRGSQLRDWWDTSSVIPDILTVRRAPFYANGIGADPRLSEILYDADTSRILIAPVFSRGKLVGFIDMRDKARQQPFEEQDLPRAQGIADALLSVLARHGMYGLRVQQEEGPAGAAEGDVVRLHEPKPVERSSNQPGIVEAAQATLARGALRRGGESSPVGERQVRAAAMMLPAIVAMPGVVAAILTPVSRFTSTQVGSAKGMLTPEAVDQLDSRIRTWLRKRGVEEPVVTQIEWNRDSPAGTAPVGPERMQSILSAPASRSGEMAMVLTVAFEMQTDSRTRASLERFLADAEKLILLADSESELESLRQRTARYLLEPDLDRREHLVDHCVRVSELAEKLAQHAGLGVREVETIRLAALVHDVGMRLLDYDRLYRKDQLTTDEVRYLRQHPVVGAAVLAESPLGPEIAALVLHHHERPDGTGYPDRLAGEAIPVGSRIIAICEAFDAMTSPDSYQPPVSRMAAVGKIRRTAGEQFDAELAEHFARMMQSSA